VPDTTVEETLELEAFAPVMDRLRER